MVEYLYFGIDDLLFSTSYSSKGMIMDATRSNINLVMYIQ